MQDIAEERNQEQIALQRIVIISFHILGNKTPRDVALRSGTLLLEGKNVFAYPGALAAIGGFICEEFILKEHIRGMMFLLLFFFHLYMH